MLDLGLSELGDGGGAATKWQRGHAARKRRDAAAKLRKLLAHHLKIERAELRADLKKRKKKWWANWKKRAAAAKAAGLPRPKRAGQPHHSGIKNPQCVDMHGKRFGRLLVVRSAPLSIRYAKNKRGWVVLCDCGSGERRVCGSTLRQGLKVSCGCIGREIRAARKKQKREPRIVALLSIGWRSPPRNCAPPGICVSPGCLKWRRLPSVEKRDAKNPARSGAEGSGEIGCLTPRSQSRTACDAMMMGFIPSCRTATLFCWTYSRWQVAWRRAFAIASWVGHWLSIEILKQRERGNRMVADARCSECGGVKIPNGTTAGEPPCRCSVTTSHELMRAAIRDHGIARDEVAILMATTPPRVTSKLAGELYDKLMAGEPCKTIVGMAVIRLVAQKSGISLDEAVNKVLRMGK